MQKEYGGCLPLEINKINTDYFPGFDYVALNSGRNAIAYACLAFNYKTCYIPYYTCKTVEAGLLEVGVEVRYYNIDEQLMPIAPEGGFDDRALFVYTNYFGIMTHVMQQDIIAEHSHVLFDNTQGFFTQPMRGTLSAYSCRKFFGVADGAFLVGADIPRLDIPTGNSADAAGFLLKAIEAGPNEAYAMSKENEEHINVEGMCYMSKLTETMMSGIDLESVNEKRISNFNKLHELLGQYNELKPVLENGAPMVYPFLFEKEGLREMLVEKKIFVPRWWRWIEESKDTNAFEKKLSKYLVPLPITQTYDDADMEYIADILLKGIQ
ncbi:dTDP-4-amino-4,6-dideoxygalactose transaminase [Pseudobutyrivibrio ruminis]|uniref:dTDP-4-amino-4,6-dideoxygalactose transaminase n=1 Tax=Pseudobutyrivibrio ruminis TaxID=46206 RepID=A0A1H7H479_9FIRM|nr:hypothetical protein [Pseudobutyrivibrio ruminis]SEK44092.1 dTDP-4-amino-4,6-dideoxygalactose transaminase [Pseudobutyrivibrio ruminis]